MLNLAHFSSIAVKSSDTVELLGPTPDKNVDFKRHITKA